MPFGEQEDGATRGTNSCKQITGTLRYGGKTETVLPEKTNCFRCLSIPRDLAPVNHGVAAAQSRLKEQSFPNYDKLDHHFCVSLGPLPRWRQTAG